MTFLSRIFRSFFFVFFMWLSFLSRSLLVCHVLYEKECVGRRTSHLRLFVLLIFISGSSFHVQYCRYLGKVCGLRTPSLLTLERTNYVSLFVISYHRLQELKVLIAYIHQLFSSYTSTFIFVTAARHFYLFRSNKMDEWSITFTRDYNTAS